MSSDRDRGSLRLLATLSVLWCIGTGAVAVHKWHENESRRTYLGRSECRAENPRPPAWCNDVPQEVEEFSARPYVLLAFAVPAALLVGGYAVGRTVSRFRR